MSPTLKALILWGLAHEAGEPFAQGILNAQGVHSVRREGAVWRQGLAALKVSQDPAPRWLDRYPVTAE